MQEPYYKRERWALGMTIFLSTLIFVSFAFYKGFINIDGKKVALDESFVSDQNVASAVIAPSPLDNSKEFLSKIFDEFNSQYKDLKESLYNVFVPFVTGIDVYEIK